MQIFELLGAILNDIADVDFMKAIITYDEDTDAVACTYTYLPMIDIILALFGENNLAHWKNARIVFSKIGDDYVISSVSLRKQSMEMIMDSDAIFNYVSEKGFVDLYHEYCNKIAILGLISS